MLSSSLRVSAHPSATVSRALIASWRSVQLSDDRRKSHTGTTIRGPLPARNGSSITQWIVSLSQHYQAYFAGWEVNRTPRCHPHGPSLRRFRLARFQVAPRIPLFGTHSTTLPRTRPAGVDTSADTHWQRPLGPTDLSVEAQCLAVSNCRLTASPLIGSDRRCCPINQDPLFDIARRYVRFTRKSCAPTPADIWMSSEWKRAFLLPIASSCSPAQREALSALP